MGEYKSVNFLNKGALPFAQNTFLQDSEAGVAGLCIIQEPAVLQGATVPECPSLSRHPTFMVLPKSPTAQFFRIKGLGSLLSDQFPIE